MGLNKTSRHSSASLSFLIHPFHFQTFHLSNKPREFPLRYVLLSCSPSGLFFFLKRDKRGTPANVFFKTCCLFSQMEKAQQATQGEYLTKGAQKKDNKQTETVRNVLAILKCFEALPCRRYLTLLNHLLWLLIDSANGCSLLLEHSVFYTETCSALCVDLWILCVFLQSEGVYNVHHSRLRQIYFPL